MKRIVHTSYVLCNAWQNLFIYHWTRTHYLVYKSTWILLCLKIIYWYMEEEWIFIIGTEIHPADIEEWHNIKKYLLLQ